MTFDITKICCFPFNRPGSWRVELCTSPIQTWAWRLSALLAGHKSPHQAEGEGESAHLEQRSRIWSNRITPLRYRAVSRFSAWLWKQHPGGHRVRQLRSVTWMQHCTTQGSKSPWHAGHAPCSDVIHQKPGWKQGMRTKLKQVAVERLNPVACLPVSKGNPRFNVSQMFYQESWQVV